MLLDPSQESNQGRAGRGVLASLAFDITEYSRLSSPCRDCTAYQLIFSGCPELQGKADLYVEQMTFACVGRLWPPSCDLQVRRQGRYKPKFG
jgi:hypothetical protein